MEAEHQFAAQRLGQSRKRGQNLARILAAVHRGKQELAELEKGEEAVTFPVVIHHRQDAEIFFIHQPQCLRRRGIRANTQDFPLHHIRDLGRDIRDKFRRRRVERFQDEIDAVVGVAAARGNRLGHAGAAFKIGVADGRADRVGVRITMANDQDFTHSRRTKDREATPVRQAQAGKRVPPVSQPAVSPTSKSARACNFGNLPQCQGPRVWKPATQQIGESAVRHCGSSRRLEQPQLFDYSKELGGGCQTPSVTAPPRAICRVRWKRSPADGRSTRHPVQMPLWSR